MLEKYLLVFIISVMLLFSLHTNTAMDLYYQYGIESIHTREGLLGAL